MDNKTTVSSRHDSVPFFYCDASFFCAISLLIVIPFLPAAAARSWENFRAYTAGAAIPIGIAVGRQRLQETTNQLPQLLPKDLNRFGLGLADLGKWKSN